jgi:hypothetical protein
LNLKSITNQTWPSLQDVSESLQSLINEYLGVTYNPLDGTFRNTCVLDMAGTSIQTFKRGRYEEDFSRGQNLDQGITSTKIQLGFDLSVNHIGGLSEWYSSTREFRSMFRQDSEFFLVKYIISVTKIAKPLSPLLSSDMLKEISQLPHFSKESKSEYDNFFRVHGTHVVTAVAGGGIMRIVGQGSRKNKEMQKMKKFEVDTGIQVPQQVGIAKLQAERTTAEFADGSIETEGWHVFTDGGEPGLARSLQILTRPGQKSPFIGTKDQEQWRKSVDGRPGFLPDIETCYKQIHDFGGLTHSQKRDLKRAADSYFGIEHEHPQKSNLPREENEKKVTSLLERCRNFLHKVGTKMKGSSRR